MRKTLIYLAILAVLFAGIYYLLPGSKNDNPFDPAEAGFTITDTGSIGKIFLVATGGESVLVTRTDSGWMLNNKYKVLPSTLNMLLNTFMNQAPLYPVTKSAYKNAIEVLATHGTKVEVYDRAGKKMKVFYVGGAAVNNVGTNMLMEGAKTPYVVEAPGFVGYLTPRYATKVRDWRDRTIFSVAANDIKSVSVQYADKPDESFTVTRDATEGIKVITAPKFMNSGTPLNTKRAELYLRFFGNINCEGYLNGLEDNDTTFKTAPKHSDIELVTTTGKVQHVDVYWMAVNRRSKNRKESDVKEVLDEYDSDRLYAVTNDHKDTMMIQLLSFKNIFRKGKDFYSQEVAPPHPPASQLETKSGAKTR